jgi:hypothetical protein
VPLRVTAYVRLGFQGFAGANTLAYFASISVAKEKSFITLTTSDIDKYIKLVSISVPSNRAGPNVLRLFTAVITVVINKIVRS